VLAEFLRGTTLFRLAEAQAELEAEFGRPVELVDRQTLRAFARPSVDRDFVPL
jgi:predicted nucleotidyltransferase